MRADTELRTRGICDIFETTTYWAGRQGYYSAGLIANCQLPIANWETGSLAKISKWQLEIGNGQRKLCLNFSFRRVVKRL